MILAELMIIINIMTEDEMEKMMAEMSKYADMPKVIKIEVCYDENLQKITSVATEPMFMSEWSTFVYLLYNIFLAYPEIEKKYPPGKLKIIINGVAPRLPTTPLFTGDKVEFSV